MNFNLVMVKSNVDFIICQKGFCTTCLETKTNDEIIQVYPIEAAEVKTLAMHGVTAYRLKCICH